MVGEVRDLETADIAVKASQTGHLVLSTLHTNDAPSTIVRLLNMGVAPFNVAASVHLILAQRLVRKLCSVCRKPVEYPEDVLTSAGFSQSGDFSDLKLYGPEGCDECTRGFKGRTGVFQVMPVTEAIARRTDCAKCRSGSHRKTGSGGRRDDHAPGRTGESACRHYRS